MASQTVPRSAARVLVSESTPMGGQLILEALRRDPRFQAVGVFTGSQDFSRVSLEVQPDIAIIAIDPQIGERKGFSALRQALTCFPSLQAIALLNSSNRDLVVEAFRAGARGVICRDDGLEALRKCIYAVFHGQIWANSAQLRLVLEVFSRRWAPQSIVDVSGRNLLSKRELDVVRCVSEGMSNREVAVHLGLSEHTVKNYIFRTFDKLGVSSRAELILYAINHGCAPDALPQSAPGVFECERCAKAARIEPPPSGRTVRRPRDAASM